MSTAVLDNPSLEQIHVNPVLLNGIIDAMAKGATMCSAKLQCVGVSAVPTAETGLITGMIGVHGKVSGFVTINMPERFVIKAVEGILQEEFGKITPEVIDGAGEISNIIVGGIKSALSQTSWSFSQITVPSVIVGQNFSIAYAKGLEFITVTFEHDNPEAVLLEERTINVSVSMLSL